MLEIGRVHPKAIHALDMAILVQLDVSTLNMVILVQLDVSIWLEYE